MQKIYNFNNCFDTIQGRLYRQNSPYGISLTASADTRLVPTSIVGADGSVFATFSNQTVVPFPIGSSISVIDISPYSGTYSVTTASITGSTATLGWSASSSGTATITTSSIIRFAQENKIIVSSVASLTSGMSVESTNLSASVTISSILTSSNLIVLSQDNLDKISSGQYLYVGRNTIINTRTPVDCLNVFKRKVISSGLTGDPTRDTITQLQDAFEDALSQSPNSEEVIIVEDPSYERRLCLVTELSTKWNSDIKNIAIPFSNQMEVGKTIDWIRTGYKYLVMTQNLTQKAYFSGTMHQCNFLLKWKDLNGNEYSQYIVVDGPNEKEEDYIKKEKLVFDTGNAGIQIYIGRTPASYLLVRYNRILLNNRSWKIYVINDMENENILRFSLQESFVNDSVDDTVNNIADNKEYAVAELQSLVLNDLS